MRSAGLRASQIIYSIDIEKALLSFLAEGLKVCVAENIWGAFGREQMCAHNYTTAVVQRKGGCTGVDNRWDKKIRVAFQMAVR